jgi:very-short-patch-repair endonuclease
VARRQLLRAGLSAGTIDRLVAAGTLILLTRGVYAVGHRPVGIRSREMAVALMGGVHGLAWQSALALWGMRRPWHGPVHALGAHSRRGPGVVIHRARNLPPGDLTTHWGITVTTPLRTLLDLSGTLSLEALDAALAEALVRKLVRLEAVRARATGKLRELLVTAAPTRSRLERDLRKILHEHALPQPHSNGFVCGYEVDLHWPEHRLVAELDGWLFHGHRRAFETDRERDLVLATHGWRSVRLTAAQHARRTTVAERFGMLLAPTTPHRVRGTPPTWGVGP